jgi:hypothetical protein
VRCSSIEGFYAPRLLWERDMDTRLYIVCLYIVVIFWRVDSATTFGKAFGNVRVYLDSTNNAQASPWPEAIKLINSYEGIFSMRNVTVCLECLVSEQKLQYSFLTIKTIYV